ncbi:helix-turn-helix transcriptional regulator [Streptomyces sp. VRA16 Mangrove soil]|uniref:ArsR/SmtB family transcription factor n=1 Tax=Streptomyces sp. VRA16 Mangrove soil TaxID=2817434 RepID=UPI001A9F8D07|nr:winged helix-turn-helix domain-containing protein [Streptomyces sp. VRA16 Mangrove soil]MBO1331919.1 winged helix-turn-helix transcriptional regulator [Streptomyces sp. VRA16 Mangrove soil]
MTAAKDPRARRLAALAALVSDETRAAFLLALLDGRAWTAGELARHAGVAASTTSEHLGKLIAGGLLGEERQGRHRYVRLADPQVAQLVEDLAGYVAPEDADPPRTLRAASARDAMARGRTCYDHLAGRLGIAVTDGMVARGLLRTDAGFALTEAGVDWFRGLGVEFDRGGRRPPARGCLDWTERRLHLAGAAGAALCRHALAAGWVERIGSERAVRVTGAGERALRAELGWSP